MDAHDPEHARRVNVQTTENVALLVRGRLCVRHRGPMFPTIFTIKIFRLFWVNLSTFSRSIGDRYLLSTNSAPTGISSSVFVVILRWNIMCDFYEVRTQTVAGECRQISHVRAPRCFRFESYIPHLLGIAALKENKIKSIR